MSDDNPPAGGAAVDEQKVIEGEQAPQSKEEAEKDKAVQDLNDEVAKDGQLRMYVRVNSPFKEYYDGSAFSLSAENATGPFDILPKHHNFISLLMPCEVVVRTDKGEEQRIQIGGGVMHVKADRVIVFLDV